MDSNLMLERLHGEGDELNLKRCVDRTVASPIEQNSMWKGPEVKGLEGYLVRYEGGQ